MVPLLIGTAELGPQRGGQSCYATLTKAGSTVAGSKLSRGYTLRIEDMNAGPMDVICGTND